MNNRGCDGCVFAIHNKVDGQMRQVNCSLRELSKYKAAGYPVEFNQLRRSFVIQNIDCYSRRGYDWAKKTKEAGLKLHEAVKLEQKRLSCNTIIIADDDITALDVTVTSLAAQKLKPSKITVVIPHKNYEGRHFATMCIEYMQKNSPIPWEVVEHQEDTAHLTDVIIRRRNYKIYTIFYAGCKVNKTFISKIHHFIYVDLKIFGVILPDEHGNGYVGVTSIYKHFMRHELQTLENRLKEESCEHLIFDHGSLS